LAKIFPKSNHCLRAKTPSRDKSVFSTNVCLSTDGFVSNLLSHNTFIYKKTLVAKSQKKSFFTLTSVKVRAIFCIHRGRQKINFVTKKMKSLPTAIQCPPAGFLSGRACKLLIRTG
jgi:hypothetical protein